MIQKIFGGKNSENPKITPKLHFQVFVTQKVGSGATQASRMAPFGFEAEIACFS